MHKKKLSDSDLGWGTSHQTHVGLHEDMLNGWSEEDQIYECYLFIDRLERCIECQAVINAITSENGTIRSPKIKTGTGIPDDKNLLKLIREHATEERRFLTLGELPDGKILAFLSDCQSDAAEQIRQRTLVPEAELGDLGDLLQQFKDAVVDHAGLKMPRALLGRLLASLMAKRFLILTGLSGSGKTKLGQAVGKWFTEPYISFKECFLPGTEVQSDRINYYVNKADSVGVELRNEEHEEDARKIVLPREMIEEWADYIKENGIARTTPAREIREAVRVNSNYSSRLHSFETDLKAAAFHLIEKRGTGTLKPRCIVVPVGADWTSREQMLGYHDGINTKRYVKQATLQLILEAAKEPDKPHFLILDEMNLSHVERYFSDFLSAIESGEEIPMHEEDEPIQEVSGKIALPKNLFVIGTVNVDETTYMFSPKVLDRANVIEFRVETGGFTEFLDDPKSIDLDTISGKGEAYGPSIVNASRTDVTRELLYEITETLEDGNKSESFPKLRAELEVLFRIFQHHGWDFGFRVGKEVSRYTYFHRKICVENWRLKDALDAQIIQKLMPKLNGSEAKLSAILEALAWYCSGREEELHEGNSIEGKTPKDRAEAIISKAEDSTADDPKKILQGLSADEDGNKGRFPLSMEKTARMWNAVKINGFTSFAEN